MKRFFKNKYETKLSSLTHYSTTVRLWYCGERALIPCTTQCPGGCTEAIQGSTPSRSLHSGGWDRHPSFSLFLFTIYHLFPYFMLTLEIISNNSHNVVVLLCIVKNVPQVSGSLLGTKPIFMSS